MSNVDSSVPTSEQSNPVSETPVPETPVSETVPETPSQTSSPNRWLWVVLAVMVTTGGIATWRSLAAGPASEPAVAQQGPPPRAVETTALTQGTSARQVQLLGQVEASERATVRAQTSGVIQQLLVQPGERVQPGMTIAVLDGADQQLALSQAEARLAQQRSNLARLTVGTRPEIIAQREAALSAATAREQEAIDNLRRTETLVQEGALSQRGLIEARSAVDAARGERLEAQAQLAEAQAGPIREEIDAQRANMAAAQAEVNQAKLAQLRTQVKATSTGVVERRLVSRGDYVQNNGELVSLISGDRLDIFLELPEELTGRVTPGMPIQLTSRALPQWNQRTTVTAVVPAADSASRRQRVRVRLENVGQRLLPGMAITGTLGLPSNRPSFVVSRDTLTQRQNQWLVFALAEGKAKQIPVEMVTDMGETVAIYSSELQPGQEIVLRGGDTLRDGAPVKVVQNNQP
ncbi:efflux RND transporter periplasmic adaptor subunit [Leptolyngbya sp. FACHB-261]|uniref:efflux RND transporter periplasmic adaptor subunit n=1 Tax=Leptolyngbya sp. FACHB-261 TaxID=2692806 RepID=UPI001683C21B|nr:efflux RND transporter periplasmic adaptor subunit [Leptolyngbya sp. FACHB-261]MBD2099773.1 efflux RND transporter periplasmic adaptor subunit [Leptolyngbya sp. FACHB-261]